MTDGHAVTVLPVPRTCEIRDCKNDSDVSMIVEGEYDQVGIAAYCDECADGLESSEHHTALGVIRTRQTKPTGERV